MDHSNTIARLFLDGKEEEAYHFLQTAQTPFDRLQSFEQVLTPAMYYIGELWEKNEITVADEHLATAVCDFLLSKLDSRVESAGREGDKKVLLFGVEEEQHYLGLKMVASVFREYGWKVRYLGPNLPIDHAKQQIDVYKPDVIGISASLSYRLPTLKNVVASLISLNWKPTILLGGRMTKEYDLSAMFANEVLIMDGLETLQYWLEEEQTKIDATS
ncbi:B12-binding domain-containing protein [Pontibacillus salicampi]|uniref:B12-binding domain-containing protein n=1 Tax=Pontibacillus salicampi TaxID=1449801 RepID=A0ABV6LNC0_9BACI